MLFFPQRSADTTIVGSLIRAMRSPAMVLSGEGVVLASNGSLDTFWTKHFRVLDTMFARRGSGNLTGNRLSGWAGDRQVLCHAMARTTREGRQTVSLPGTTLQIHLSAVAGMGKSNLFLAEWQDDCVSDANLDNTSQVEALNRSQAVIEFDMDHRVLKANENFLKVMGYTLDEIVGQPHALFIKKSATSDARYKEFWEALSKGKSHVGEFERRHKDGSSVWIHGSYNPIRDENGKIIKIVKFATDVTARVQAVHRIGTALSALANGNVTEMIDRPLTPELEVVRHDYNKAAERLREALEKIVRCSRAIRESASRQSSTASEMARRTSQQASTLGQATRTLGIITQGVRKTATDAYDARQIVSRATEDAEQSGAVVDKTMDAMRRVEDSSKAINQIIGVIDDITLQTNLLALNAGIEAARAGDAGQGFAVVAAEVRALASRSSEAAREVKALVVAANVAVEEGVISASNTGRTLQTIARQVAEIDNVITGISQTANTQSLSLDEVNEGMGAMNSATQDNVQYADQALQSSSSLTEDANELDTLVSKFQLSRMARSGSLSHQRPLDHESSRSLIDVL